MRILLKMLAHIAVIVALTIFTQIGGVLWLLWFGTTRWRQNTVNNYLGFTVTYLLFSAFIVPRIAPFFGREPLVTSDNIQSVSFLTQLFNRHYVVPELNNVLVEASEQLPTEVQIRSLDANFPFINGFPLFPHLSHNDGKKLDLAFVYLNGAGEVANQSPSRIGYGVFEKPETHEFNQAEFCKDRGYWQYSFTKYFTLGTPRPGLEFSNVHTRQVLVKFVNDDRVGKIFVERHLVERMGLSSDKLRFQGCGAVRHDDHIHIQLR